jgi:plasmid stabilization system protein ParE
MPSVVTRPKALEDLAGIWAYIAEDSPRQADAFAAAINRGLAHFWFFLPAIL